MLSHLQRSQKRQRTGGGTQRLLFEEPVLTKCDLMNNDKMNYFLNYQSFLW